MRSAGLPAQRLSHASFRDCLVDGRADADAPHRQWLQPASPETCWAAARSPGAQPAEAGSLLELTAGGKQPLQLAGGEMRTFLEDGDQVTLRGWCERPGCVRIGFGEATGTVLAAS